MSDDHKCTRHGAGGGHDGHVHGITCQEISEFLLAYLERDLDGNSRVQFEAHLNLCPPCVHYLDGYRETIELVRRCVRDPSDSSGAQQGCDATAQKPKQKPPEGLIQAILAAKRSAD